MRKIILVTAIMGIFALSACGEKDTKHDPTPTPTTAVALLADTDKATINGLGGDAIKLTEVFTSATGAKRDYAEEQLITAIRSSSDQELIKKLSTSIPGPSRAQMEAKIRANILSHSK
jgi:hypothetical protein